MIRLSALPTRFGLGERSKPTKLRVCYVFALFAFALCWLAEMVMRRQSSSREYVFAGQ